MTETDPTDERRDAAPPEGITRRHVLGAAAAGASALAVGSSGLARAAAAATRPKPGHVKPAESGIEHIVVVMMENRSFDHMLGWLPGANGIQAGLTFRDHEGVSHPTWHLDTFQGLQFGDPDHSYAGGRLELNKGKCNGFLKAGTDDVFPIGYYLPEDLAFYANAAPYWCVCDHFFASIMGPTFPNRFYMHTAQTDRITNTGTTSTLPTIWESLADANVSGRYYFSDAPITALFGSRLASITSPFSQFLTDCAAGELPSVSYIDPRFVGESTGTSGDDHPFADIRVGQAFLDQIYTAVTTGPDWDTSVLVITYDEWGGFFDHVPPSSAPDVDPSHKLRGFRVPTFVISPLAKRGHIAHGVYDHTSILAMIEWRYGLAPLTPRDAAARNLVETLDLTKAPDLTAPQWSVPTPDDIDTTASRVAATEHERDFVMVMDKAESLGFDL
jgi:phospholipase C